MPIVDELGRIEVIIHKCSRAVRVWTAACASGVEQRELRAR